MNSSFRRELQAVCGALFVLSAVALGGCGSVASRNGNAGTGGSTSTGGTLGGTGGASATGGTSGGSGGAGGETTGGGGSSPNHCIVGTSLVGSCVL